MYVKDYSEVRRVAMRATPRKHKISYLPNMYKLKFMESIK